MTEPSTTQNVKQSMRTMSLGFSERMKTMGSSSKVGAGRLAKSGVPNIFFAIDTTEVTTFFAFSCSLKT